MRKLLLGAVLMLVILLLSALAVMRLGLIPVNADGAHSSLEARIMPLVLHASITRHAPGDANPILVNEENLKAGASTYQVMCARCHSTHPEAIQVSTGNRSIRRRRGSWEECRITLTRNSSGPSSTA